MTETTLTVPDDVAALVDDFITQEKLIGAIKVVRDATGCQLGDARDWVYARAGRPVLQLPDHGDPVPARVREHLATDSGEIQLSRDEAATLVRWVDGLIEIRDQLQQLRGEERAEHERLLGALERQVRSLTAENDRLHEDVADVNESLNGVMERATYSQALQAERDRLAAQVQRVRDWAADRIDTAIGRPYAIQVQAALNGSDGWVESLTGRAVLDAES